MREIRVSPDGNAVAIRSDNPVDAQLAWGVLDMTRTGSRVVGGRWAASAQVADWTPLSRENEG